MIVPCRLRGVGSVDAWKDHDRWVAVADRFADRGERLVVGDAEGKLRDGVGCGWYNGVAVNRRVRTRLGGQPGLSANGEPCESLDPAELAGGMQPGRCRGRQRHDDGPTISLQRHYQLDPDVFDATGRAGDQSKNGASHTAR